jgi:ABC-2 type transport system ATP-binding protein
VVAVLRQRSVSVVDVGLRRPTLDDVFLTLTGHSAEEVAEDGEEEHEHEDAEPADDEREKEVVR